MLDVVIIGTLFAGTIALVSVCFYNIRRSRCVRCKGCGVELDRDIMSLESMKEDKLTIPYNMFAHEAATV
jgi:hypothetical protein